MMEQRYVKPTATHVAAELLDKKPGVRVTDFDAGRSAES